MTTNSDLMLHDPCPTRTSASQLRTLPMPLLWAVCALAMGLLVFIFYRQLVQEFSDRHAKEVELRTVSIQDSINLHVAHLRMIADQLQQMDAVVNVDLAMLRETTPEATQFRFVAWAPRLADPSRWRASPASGPLRDLNADGELALSTERDAYFPITHVFASDLGPSMLLGVDPVSTMTAGALAGEQRLDVIASAPIVHDGRFCCGSMLIAVGVYGHHDIVHQSDPYSPLPDGFVVGMVDIGYVIDASIIARPPTGHDVSVYIGAEPVHSHPSRRVPEDSWIPWDLLPAPDIRWETALSVGDRTLRIGATPRPGLVVDEVYRPVGIFAGSGLAVLLLVLLFVRMVDSRRKAMQALTEDLMETNRSLDEYREFTRALLDSVDNGIVACDESGDLKLFNRRTQELHGLPAEPIPASEWASYYDLYMADGVTPMRMEDVPLFRALRGEEVRDAEMAIRPKGSESRYLLATGQAMRTKSGRMLGAVVSMSDITETRRAEEARLQAEQALRRSQRLEAVGQLTGGVAHDFNNLLGIVMGNLEFLKRSVDGDAKALKRVESALKATRRGSQLTRRLLSFSSQEAQPGTPTDANQVLAELKDMLARSLTSEVDLEIHPDAGLWLTDIDPGDLEDAVLNLALNARDAMPDSGRLVIETANRTMGGDGCDGQSADALEPGDYVVISVSDTGCGMPPEVMERVLEPFFTTKTHDRGSGLGLSMVYGFAKRSRGDIRFYSEVGHGTTVRLFLPRSAETAAATADASADLADAQLPRGSETVLLVDDEPDLLDLANHMLRGLGYTTLTAANGQEALDILKDEAAPHVDLIFSDVIMPGGINGFELAERIAALRPSVRILLASGFTGKLVGDGRNQKLARKILHKPYDRTALAQSVRQALAA